MSCGIAANHDPVAVAVHELNFPGAEHLPPGDVARMVLADLQIVDRWADNALQ
ncbi:hypothetical protein [Nocardia sp. CA-120079]|uniref:hypothetical protein n=1 Tax=Nocardia sp. CA-120079 TaxID=3239974 RepID=UPI003D990536